MSGPYINIALYTRVMLLPNQMRNNIYLNLKNNLIKKVGNRCFGNHGYISDVYEILKYEEGVMYAENFSASAIFSVKFSCRLCSPLVKQSIVCKVDKMNKSFLKLVNGPITVIITNDRINDKVFFVDTQRNIRYKKGKSSLKISDNDYVKVIVETISFSDGSDRIMIIGLLEDMASDVDIKQFFEDQMSSDTDKLTEYNEYIKQFDKKEPIVDTLVDDPNTLSIEESKKSPTSKKVNDDPKKSSNK
jgi:DNA-directed RNA polymerase subunit E'/Rpb7